MEIGTDKSMVIILMLVLVGAVLIAVFGIPLIGELFGAGASGNPFAYGTGR